jgi:preprotein translocase subunit SecA
MNLELFNIATQGVAAVGTFLVNEDQERFNKYSVDLVALTDEELRARCLQAVRGEDTQEVQQGEGLIPSITARLPWFERRASLLTIKRIAVAIEAFKRAPADLPSGSALYPQQIQAAISLTRHCLIQMDTGEGKTYALLPAAFALACEYHRVYIVCANEYLAWRDAHRTRTFWEFAGLQHSLCLGLDTDDWSSRVIYTTLTNLIFRHMSNLSSTEEPSTPISFGAILLDEADAILLDQGSQTFALIQHIKAEAFDWSFALDYAQTLVEGEEIETDYSNLTANLTITGETRLRETLSRNTFQDSTYLLTRFAVELAYVAIKVAAEDRDYIIEDDRIYAVDPITGKVLRDRSPQWMIPLEIRKNFSPRAESITTDEITTLTFLGKFQHLAGLSGTIVDDALDYLFIYFLPTLVIKPRRKRHQGVEPDLIYRTKAEAWEALCEEVLEAYRARRPVLIGTQNIADAEKIYRMLSDCLPPSVRLSLLTGKNDHEVAQIFEHSGEVGSVVVATQLAGRGVDIRLSEAARQNGGLVLLCLGHSLTIRLDKQFLGRAGRQGDPFTARFICSLQDELLRQFAGEKIDKMMQMLGMEHGVAIESPMVSRRIAAAQNDYRRSTFWRNQQQSLLNATSSEIRKSLETWFEYLQLPNSDDAPKANCSQEFLEWVVDLYLENLLADVLSTRKSITLSKAEQITGFLNASLGLTHRSQPFSAQDIEARDTESATLTLRKLLLKKLNDATGEYQKVCQSLNSPFMPSAEEEEGATEENEATDYSSYLDSYHLYWKVTNRTPRRIAFWSIRSGWIGFMLERSRIIHRVYQKRLSYLEQYRSITDQITNEWQKVEKDIATRVLRNLLRSAQPAALDDLFVYEDNSIDSPDNEKEKNFFTWEGSTTEERDSFDPKENVRLLIGQFVAQANSNLNETFSVSHLRRLLSDFTDQNPLYQLQGPSQIQKALEAWSVAENERGVTAARRKVHKKWLRQFLLFLRERKLIGALPTLQTRLQSALAKFIKTITETRTALASLGIVAFLVFFLLVLNWGNFAQPKQLGPFGTVLDQILFAGLLAQGNIAAPAFGILIIASIITIFVFPYTVDALKDTVPFERFLTPLLQLAFAWWLTDWQYGQMTVMSVLRSFGVFIGILAVSLITKRVAWLLHNTVGINLVAGWLIYSVLCVFLPSMVGAQATKWVPIIFFVSAAGACYFWQYFNAHEIELVSRLLKSSVASMQGEEISGNLQVKADCGASPHVYGVLCAWLLYEILKLEAVSTRVSLNLHASILILATVYFMVVVGRIVYIINRRFSVEMWQADLNTRHQTIKDVHNREQLQHKLEELKRLLLRRELAFQALILSVAVYLMYAAFLPTTTFPLSLVIVFTVFLFAASSKKFALQLYMLLYNRMPLDTEVLDFSKVPEEREQLSGWRHLKRAAKIVFASLIAVYGFFEVVTVAYEILKKLHLIS